MYLIIFLTKKQKPHMLSYNISYSKTIEYILIQFYVCLHNNLQISILNI